MFSSVRKFADCSARFGIFCPRNDLVNCNFAIFVLPFFLQNLQDLILHISQACERFYSLVERLEESLVVSLAAFALEQGGFMQVTLSDAIQPLSVSPTGLSLAWTNIITELH